MTRSPYHLVEPSPWPIIIASSSLFVAISLINWFHYNKTNLLIISSMILIISSFQWWRDITREATYMGKHTTHVQKGLRLGMLLFIMSEICFFFAFFWTFFHSSLAPAPELGCSWPPVGMSTIDPFSVPLLNTAILLASGFTVTWAHHSMLLGKRHKTIFSLMLTVCLGIYFTYLQSMEYMETTFTIADSVFGSIFFMSTGFHGVHVIIGTTFLLVCLIRLMMHHFSKNHHFGFEAAAWYWHFVDVVWICLYICIYWWSHL